LKVVKNNKLPESNKLYLKRYSQDANLISYEIWNKRWSEIIGSELSFAYEYENFFK